jgi:hypothetical protein
MIPNRVPMERDAPSPEANGLLIHLYTSDFPFKELSQEMGEKHSHHPRWPMQAEGLHTMGQGLVPQRDCLRHCYHYPSELQPSARYLTLWLGQTTTLLVSV